MKQPNQRKMLDGRRVGTIHPTDLAFGKKPWMPGIKPGMTSMNGFRLW
jgi:hypothetical protein